MLLLSQFPVTPAPESQVITDQWSILFHWIGQMIASAVWMILAWRAMRAHERAAGGTAPSNTTARPGSHGDPAGP